MGAVVVTGASSGIGKAVAEVLVQQGRTVVAVARRRDKLNDLRAALGALLLPLPCDLTQPSSRATLLEEATQQAGPLDALVYSAGVVVHQAPGAITDDALTEQLAINLVAPLRLGEDALTRLSPGGAIINIASTLAERPIVTSAVYSATKAGLIALTKSLALAGAKRTIRACTISPGVVDTDMIAKDRIKQLLPLHPLGRLGTPDDIAQAVVYLLQASWVTGVNFTIDGGLLLRE